MAKRYDFFSDKRYYSDVFSVECSDGEYVTYEDYATLQAENAKLRKVADSATKLAFYHQDFCELHDAMKEAGYSV